ncbi:MAG: hypothetical protein FWD24_01465 [Treponema sp.]|nr:hypothetical protein [Treponema sp.]
MNLLISDEAFENYIKRSENNYPQNSRIRPDNMDFFDALLSVDMAATSEGREILDVISKLD